jgi:predicted transport protein
MNNLKYVTFEKLSMKTNAKYDEKWLQDRIAEAPSILGLGDLILKDKERIQPKAGRLDLLLQDSDSNQRYEVEIQLGKIDESHIIRTIEYWDIERKRYPQYDHVAVIVAEDITSRFLNVIGLFNGFIPLIAIQMNAMKCGNQISLVCTTVLDQMTLGLEEPDDPIETTNRSYWEKRSTKTTVTMADELLGLIHSFDPTFELKYNKFYIGLAKDGRPNNFAVFKPKKKFLNLEIRLEKSEQIKEIIENMDLVIDYTKWGRYKIRLFKNDIKKHENFIKEMLQQSYSRTME